MQLMVEGQTEYDREATCSSWWRARRSTTARLGCWRSFSCRWRTTTWSGCTRSKRRPRSARARRRRRRRALFEMCSGLRAALRRAEAEKLVARLESERAERAGEEHERTDWRAMAQDDLVDSDGEPCFEDPRKAEWTSLSQDPREAPEDKAVLACGFAAPGASCGGGDSGGDGEGVGEGVGGGNDLGGGLGEEPVQGLRPGRKNVGLCVTAWGAVRVMVAFCLKLIACTAKAEAIKQWCSLRETK